MGCYANIEGYKGMTKEQLLRFLKGLYSDYESIKSGVSVIEYDKIINWINSAIVDTSTENETQEKVLTILENMLSDENKKSDQEDRALIFTLHLSKSLSPNNDELEHYYLHNINYLIEHIIQQNTYSETMDVEGDDGEFGEYEYSDSDEFEEINLDESVGLVNSQ